MADSVFVVPLGGAGAIFFFANIGEHAQLAVVTSRTYAARAALRALEVFFALLLVGGLVVHGTHASLALLFGVERAFAPFLAL